MHIFKRLESKNFVDRRKVFAPNECGLVKAGRLGLSTSVAMVVVTDQIDSREDLFSLMDTLPQNLWFLPRWTVQLPLPMLFQGRPFSTHRPTSLRNHFS